ncbi:energy transducer TonB [Bacteroidota bacterium]
MRKTIIVVILVSIASLTSAQKYVKLYNKGVESFKQEKYTEADSLISLAIKKCSKEFEKKNMYFDRGVIRLYLSDTSGFCNDMKSANDREAEVNYKKLCLKYNDEANKYYSQGYHEFTQKNYKASDSLLTLSIMSYEFVDNVFLRGMARLYMLDTNSFCSDMEKIYNLNDQANQNYQKICRSNSPTSNSIEYVQQPCPCMNESEGEVFFVVENMPKFNGQSSEAFRIHIQQNLKYPVEALQNNITGRVFVQFDICKNGEVKNAKIVRGVHETLDNEVLRVISTSPKWSPGLQRNKPAVVRFTFPVVFQMKMQK